MRSATTAGFQSRTRVLGGLEAGLSALTDRDERAERALRRRTRAALHAPTVRAREAARAGDAMTYAAALTELASIPVPTVAADAR